MSVETVSYQRGHVRLLDQTRLPHEERVCDCASVEQLVEAIRRLTVRGAPAIGVAAAYGVALAAHRTATAGASLEAARAAARQAIADLRAARPTAVNLGWALDKMAATLGASAAASSAELHDALAAAAAALHEEDRELCRRMGEHGASLLADGAVVMTHCNTGALATGGSGTALAAVYQAHRQGKRIEVIACETRPLLQGARLTTWELLRAGVPVTLISDTAAGWTMREKGVGAVMLGADRIAANGDVANKIGTYNLAVLAARHRIPFYVVAPYSTLDLQVSTGEEIPIELRDPEEVRTCLGHPIAPGGVAAFNPAFDVTPAELVTAIVTEQGIFRPPYREALKARYATAGGEGAAAS